jgi:hypothetical protein
VVDHPWKRTPSGLWEIFQGYYGTEYRCTECKKHSETYLKPSTRMHFKDCDRVERGEKKKPLTPSVKKGGRFGPYRR